MADTLLEIDGIETCYGLSQVLFGLHLTIKSGEMIALMGRNGMGKTTTIRSIMGLTPARSGTIRFAGADVRTLPSYKIAQLGIGLVPEGRQIFPNLTVRENLVAASGNRLGVKEPWTLEKIYALFPRLSERSSNMGVTLSGGEQRELELAVALATKPQLLLLDEPMAGLGVTESARMVALLKELRKEVTIVLVEHDMEAVFALADRITVLVYGRVIACGKPDEIRNNEEVKRAYLGDQHVVERHG